MIDFSSPDFSNSADSQLDSIQRAAQEQFDRQSNRYGNTHILADVSDVQRLLERLPTGARPPQPARALDVATGGGHTGFHLASLGWHVVFSDISASMLERARLTALQRGLTIETRQHPAEQLPYPNTSFDLVACRVAPHHFSDPASFVRESARVLAPGGAFLLIDGSIEDNQPIADAWLHQVESLRDPSHCRLWPTGAWRRWCANAALRVVHAELQPMKQPDLDWYFETAATPPSNRAQVLELVRNAPPEARHLFRLGEEHGRIVWWWQRLELLALKS
jgi:ubiquinone/menaquinone biosynthesis C-methylase UbiE